MARTEINSGFPTAHPARRPVLHWAWQLHGLKAGKGGVLGLEEA